MKILVFDDTEKHRRAAEALLKGHDLTVVGTYDEAQSALLPKTDEDLRKDIFCERFGDRSPYKQGVSEEESTERNNYYWGEAKEKATTYPDFDVVMTDLMVPASEQAQGGEGLQYVGKEMPLGSIIALLAIAKGVKKVAIVTDTNHHDHPASAAFDCFGDPGMANYGMSVYCTNRCTTLVDENTFERISRRYLNTDEGRNKYPARQDYGHEGTLYVKSWDTVLAKLCGTADGVE